MSHRKLIKKKLFGNRYQLRSRKKAASKKTPLKLENLEQRMLLAAPVAIAGGPYSIFEDDAGGIILDSSGSSDTDGDTLSYAWDLDNDGTYEVNKGTTTTHHLNLAALNALYNSDGTANTIGLEVDDGTGNVVTTTTTLTVNNLAPTADPDGPYTINEGDNLTITTATASDPGGDPRCFR